MAGRGGWSGETTKGPAFAALDLGTNNCRLLVARPTASGFRVIDAFSRVVRLGEGLAQSGRLGEDAIQRTLDALRVCAQKIRRRAVVRSRNVATDACRRASNCEDFLGRVRSETGIDLEIITSGEEARLALAGCLPLLQGGEPRAFVFDIGGGSTELIWIDLGGDDNGGGPRILGTYSLPVGVVNVAERHGCDRIGAKAYERLVREIESMLVDFEADHRIRDEIDLGAVQMLGTSGTVTTLASISQGLPRYDRALVDGSFLERDAVLAINARLADSSHAERVDMPCIGRDRADLVVAGAAILDAIWRTWPVGRLRVADRGLREGILLNLMSERRTPCSAAVN